jgi:nucleoside-diphosphate-sugar epimerase
MKVLFIGGTGNISTSVSQACIARGIDLTLLTRGKRRVQIPDATVQHADIDDPKAVASILAGTHWDAVVNWIVFTQAQIERDIALFSGKTDQYVFISSASAYQKPPRHHIITESTPLCNPFWEYSRNKIACEERLMRAYRESEFPMTIVRPSHTYDTILPLAFGGGDEYTLIERMKAGKQIIVHGDGTSLWTLTHAEDFARGFIGLLGHPQTIGETFHITSDESLTWNQIYSTVAASVGVTPHLVHIPSDFIAGRDESSRGGLLGDKSHSVVFDNSKIKRYVPGFTATIPFHLGIRRTLAWFDADPSRKVIRKETDELMDDILRAYGTPGTR